MILFLGLGRMGLPTAGFAVRKGFDVHGYDPVEQKRQELRALGGVPEAELGKALAAADQVAIMVGQESEVDHLFRSEQGILARCGKGTLVLVNSTVSPSFIVGLEAHAVAAGIQILDAPLCRAEMAARSGTPLALTSGNSQNHRAALPLLESFCSDVFYVGDRLGMAQVAKTVNNMILWATVVANYEAFSLAESWNLNITELRKVLETSSADNWSLRMWDKVNEMPWSIKDMDIASRIAAQSGVHLPLSELVRALVANLPVLNHG